EPYREGVKVGYLGIAATALACLALLVAYSAIIIRRAARPLRHLAAAASAVAAGDRRAVAPVAGPDEVATLGAAFNEMVAAIASREDELNRLVGENEARYRELEVLNSLSQTILTAPDIDTIGQAVLDACASLGAFDVAYMYLYDRTTDTMVPLGDRGMWHPEAMTPRPHNVVDASTNGQPVLRSRYLPISSHETHVVENVDAETGFRTMKQEKVRSAIFVPLQAEDDILGILQLGSRTPRHFEPGDIRLMEAIGRQMG